MNEVKSAPAQLTVRLSFSQTIVSLIISYTGLFFLVVLHYSHCNYMQKQCNYFDNTNVQIFIVTIKFIIG